MSWSRPGNLREAIDLYRPGLVDDGAGARVSGRVLVEPDVPARVEPTMGSTVVALEAEFTEASAKVTIRWRPDIRADWSIEWKGQRYEIAGDVSNPDEREQYQVFLAERAGRRAAA